MTEMQQNNWPCGCRMIALPRIADERGKLAFGEANSHIPFQINRVFWTYDIAEGHMRGDHAHRTCSMVLFPLGGSWRILLDDGCRKKEVLMDDPSQGILIPPGVWCQIYDVEPTAACVCLASHPYDENDYIRDYHDFLKFVGQ